MAKLNIIGIKPFSFSDDSGRLIEGTNLFYLSPIDNSRGLGSEPKKVTIPTSIMKSSEFSKLGTYEVEQWEKRIISCKFIGV